MYLFLSAMGGRKFHLSARRSCRKKQQQRVINGLRAYHFPTLNPMNCELLWNLPTVVSSVPAIETKN